jgi:hypothetical protein
MTAKDILLMHIQRGDAELVCGAFEALLHIGDTVIVSELDGQTCRVKSVGHAICRRYLVPVTRSIPWQNG